MDWNLPFGRRSLLKAAGATLAAYLFSGCAPAAPTSSMAVNPTAASSNGPAGEGRTVRLFAMQGQGLFEAPNPFGSRTGPGMMQASYIFDALLSRDSTVNPIPWLAESWSSSPDGLEWTFKLRPGTKFQDGHPLSPEDVEFSYGYLESNPCTYTSTISGAVKDVKAVDEHTIKMTLKAPYAPFLVNVAASVPIIPKHIWSTVTDPKKYTDPKAFIGSGPYTLGSMNPSDSSMLFAANDGFCLGKPYVQRLEFIPAGDEFVALKAGKLDAALPLPSSAVPPEAVAPFKDDPKFGILEAPGEATTALHFNLTRGTPYNDLSFRQAVIYAIDRQEIVNRVLGGDGDPGSPGFLPPINPFSTKDVEQYAYSPQKAAELLDKAGYQLKDGQRQRPDGSPLTMPLLFASSLARVAELVRTQLSKVGVRVDLRSSDPGTASQLENAGNYEVALATYGGLGSDPEFMNRVYDSPDQAHLWYRAWGYKSAEFDRLAQAQLRTLDQASRMDLVRQMQQVVARDVPMMPLYYPRRYVIYVKAVFDNWYFTPLSTPLALNKQAFVTGKKTGIAIRND